MNNYLPYLIELRRKIIHSSVFVLLLFLGLFYIDEWLYAQLAESLQKHLPFDSSIIATEVTSAFTVPMKLAFVTAIFIAIPYLSYQVWSFISPALYPKEKKNLFPLLFASIVFFYTGVAFSYFIICPMALQFFANAAPKNVRILTDIRHYLDFVLTILLAGGLAFQVPVITLALLQAKWVSIANLIYVRPYIIVAAFVVGMLLTPPDVVSQILLALPMWGLFEMVLLVAKYLEKQSIKKIKFDNEVEVEVEIEKS